MTKTTLKKKSKDELIEMVFESEKLIDKKQQENEQLEKEIQTLRKTIFRILNEKARARIVDRQNIDYLSLAIQVRHDVCKKIKIYAKTELKENLYISETLFFDYLDKIERGEV